MTVNFRMDAPQPRLLDQTGQGVIHKPLDRPEGPLKVSGRATYAAETHLPGMAHGVLVTASIARGHVEAIDDSAAHELEGYLGCWNGERFLRNPAQGMAGAAPVQPGDRVDFRGQPIAVVVAETFETARDAARRLRILYSEEDAVTDPAEAEFETKEDADAARAVAEALETAAHRIDATYTTASHAAAAMEPHASIAEWNGDQLTLRSALQMLRFNALELADAMGLERGQVRILSPYVGGGFGSKLGLGPEAVAASMAARDLGRPVRVAMTRQQVFETVLRRSETVQRLRLAADSGGRLTALAHDNRQFQLLGEGFAEPVPQASRFLYAGAARSYRQDLGRMHRTPSGSVRAPGEAVGQLAMEAAMDELADAVGLDPVELRLRNIPDAHPGTGTRFSAHGLEACLIDGAARFGWDRRAGPRARQEGDWLIGMGMAGAARPNMLVPSEARVTLAGDRATVETDMTDIGTGSYAILSQIAAEMLGLPAENVTARLGDTDLPGASGSGGSFGAGSSGSSVFLAAKDLRGQIAALMGAAEDGLTLKDGLARAGNVEKRLADLIAEPIAATAKIEKGEMAKETHQSGYGAHFCEVAVHALTGEIRVRRFEGTFAAGRILNEKTARSQCIGGIVWGIGAALTEELVHDARTGQPVTRDLASYHVPAHADVPQIGVTFLQERDDAANPIQAKGVGELGISGAGAAVLNAVANATGVRLRDYPATPDRVIAALAAAGL
ncbi:xanthine dehydrogenase family protein molybdopterin-binding subunit [Mangrovicoccus sp. HB161399]|uniref:xanthine dehydrogenase family protein molybdopterin-binding subunit n=1 Tax=Mangrovicoccus sp. HB161399 TaxID=2720392 RepID=UPI00155630DE|nr:xanthine dehydrogenase family protein molybdopterin-binding subunit [Mangrovicoccus sp. HB161399]